MGCLLAKDSKILEFEDDLHVVSATDCVPGGFLEILEDGSIRNLEGKHLTVQGNVNYATEKVVQLSVIFTLFNERVSGPVVQWFSVRPRNKVVLSSNPALVTITTPLVREAIGNLLIKSMSVEENQSTVSGLFFSFFNRIFILDETLQL